MEAAQEYRATDTNRVVGKSHGGEAILIRGRAVLGGKRDYQRGRPISRKGGDLTDPKDILKHSQTGIRGVVLARRKGSRQILKAWSQKAGNNREGQGDGRAGNWKEISG